jgi:hypothetical protein
MILPFFGATFAMASSTKQITLNDNGVPFDATIVEASKKSCSVLFAVGIGGNPERHNPLLNSLAESAVFYLRHNYGVGYKVARFGGRVTTAQKHHGSMASC